MMLTFSFALPLVAAILCLALNRLIDTRMLAFGAAVAMLASAGALLAARANGALTLIEQPWLVLDGQSILMSLGFDDVSVPIAVLVTAGGALALVALALALPSKLRGYGGLIAALVLLLDVTLVGLAMREVLLLPLAWAALPMLSFVALRASGGQSEAQTLPAGLLGNLLGAIILLGAALSARFAGVGTAVPDVALGGVLLAGVLALGLPPFHRVVNDVGSAPANIAAPLLALGLPILGGTMLMRFGAQTVLPDGWRTALQLLGVLSLLICGAAALNERYLRRFVGWQMSAQFGWLLIALSQSQVALATITPALLTNIALSTLVALLAIGLLERRAGTDDLDEIRLSEPLALPGIALVVAAASAIGVPGTWGFLPIRWLFDEIIRSSPRLIGILLAGSALLAMAWLAPLAAFWRTPRASNPANSGSQGMAAIWPLLGALPLVVLGLAPGLAWQSWAAAARVALLARTPNELPTPALPGPLGTGAGIAALVILLGFAALQRRQTRRTVADPELEPGSVLAPHALGESLRGLAWLGAPSGMFARIWEGLAGLSRGLGWVLSFLEQRYYVAGLMIAVVAVILLLMQG